MRPVGLKIVTGSWPIAENEVTRVAIRNVPWTNVRAMPRSIALWRVMRQCQRRDRVALVSYCAELFTIPCATTLPESRSRHTDHWTSDTYRVVSPSIYPAMTGSVGYCIDFPRL